MATHSEYCNKYESEQKIKKCGINAVIISNITKTSPKMSPKCHQKCHQKMSPKNG
jgi:hypothetical protein